LYGAGFGAYANSLFPGLSAQIAGIVFVTIFYVINLLGINIMARIQKWMTGLLFAVLAMFIVAGIAKLQNPVFDFSHPNFMSNGSSGFISAVFLLVFSTQSYAASMMYGRDAKNAKRDIPWAIFMSFPTILIVYCLIAVVAVGVLPLDQVAGKPLTVAAGNILSQPLFIVFLIGGPIMALTTTTNSTMAVFTYPIAQACKDGWLPKSLAAKNRRGAYWKVLTIFYIVALIPLILNFTITIITNNMLLLMSTFSFLYTIGYVRVPSMYPEAWKKSRLHIPNGLYYLICALSFAGFAAIFIKSASNLTPAIVGVNLGVIVLCVVLGWLRSKSAKVSLETAVWDED
jgi:APA family basic amino acid/polyamine antiporter